MVQDEETLLLNAPQESQNMRTAERGITQSIHKFTFTKVGGSHSWVYKLFLYVYFLLGPVLTSFKTQCGLDENE